MHIGPDQRKRNVNLTIRILQESGGEIEKSQHKDQQMASQGLPSDMTMVIAGDGFFSMLTHNTVSFFLQTIIFLYSRLCSFARHIEFYSLLSAIGPNNSTASLTKMQIMAYPSQFDSKTLTTTAKLGAILLMESQ